MAAGNSFSSKEENVLIRAGNCSPAILPVLGVKFPSLHVNGNEPMQALRASPGPRARTMTFDSGDACGWDKCMPAVAAAPLDSLARSRSGPARGSLASPSSGLCLLRLNPFRG